MEPKTMRYETATSERRETSAEGGVSPLRKPTRSRSVPPARRFIPEDRIELCGSGILRDTMVPNPRPPVGGREPLGRLPPSPEVETRAGDHRPHPHHPIRGERLDAVPDGEVRRAPDEVDRGERQKALPAVRVSYNYHDIC